MEDPHFQKLLQDKPILAKILKFMLKYYEENGEIDSNNMDWMNDLVASVVAV